MSSCPTRNGAPAVWVGLEALRFFRCEEDVFDEAEDLWELRLDPPLPVEPEVLNRLEGTFRLADVRAQPLELAERLGCWDDDDVTCPRTSRREPAFFSSLHSQRVMIPS
jgi:hypothetical protein